MKQLLYISILLVLMSCKAQSTIQITDSKRYSSSSECEENASCFYELIPNSTIQISSDNLGHMYATIEKGDNLIFKYTFKRYVDPSLADGQYIEEVYLELDSDISEMTLKNKELSKVNLLFNRICFCKGTTGFYKISNGVLSIKKKKKNSYQLHLEFKSEEVPQITTTINETLIIK